MYDAIQGVAAMQRGRIIDLTAQRALAAAALSLRHSLPMADSIILAAARDLWRLCRWKPCRSECSVKMAGGQAPITGRLCAPTDTRTS